MPTILRRDGSERGDRASCVVRVIRSIHRATVAPFRPAHPGPFLCPSPITCNGTRHSMLPTPDRLALQWKLFGERTRSPENFRDLIRLGTDQYLVVQIQQWQVSGL